MKRFLMVLILSLILLTGCSQKVGNIENGYTDFGNLKLPQFQRPELGEEIAVITTNIGEIKIKLLDEVAPIGVGQFKKWVEEGKYTDSIFGSISKDRNVWALKKGYKKNMTEEEMDRYYEELLDSMSFPHDYEIETSPDYLHFSGAVGFLVYNWKDTDGTTNERQIGSFYIVTNEGLEEEILEIMENMPTQYGFTKDIITAYRELGGVIEYNNNLTMFGQVFYGMDIVYEISNMVVDGNKFPIEDPIIIEKIEIVKYDGE